MTILTMACRLNEHEHCAGHIYLGSIYLDPPTDCQCMCHPGSPSTQKADDQ